MVPEMELVPKYNCLKSEAAIAQLIQVLVGSINLRRKTRMLEEHNQLVGCCKQAQRKEKGQENVSYRGWCLRGDCCRTL